MPIERLYEKKDMRVLHIINSLENGGAEAVLVRLVSQKTSDTHVVISLSSPSWYSDVLADRGVAVHHLYRNSIFKSIYDIFHIIRVYRPNIIQTWMYRANVFGGVLGNIFKIPVVWGLHCTPTDNEFTLKSRFMIHLSGLLSKYSPVAIISCSRIAADAHERLGFPKEKTIVVNNGIDATTFSPSKNSRRNLRAELGISDDVFLIGTVARWHNQKDHPNLIEALRILDCEKKHNWRCLLVGSSMSKDNIELQRELVAANIVDKIILSEARRDIAAVMAAIDLHILPSAFGEAFPNVVAEAMACETPCIVTSVGDAAAMVGETGWVVPPKEPRMLAEQIDSAINEKNMAPSRWADRCLAARDRVINNFTIEKMSVQYREAWEQMLER